MGASNILSQKILKVSTEFTYCSKKEKLSVLFRIKDFKNPLA